MEHKIEQIVIQEEQELLERYFPLEGNTSEMLGQYTKDLPLKIESEYREFLEGLWRQLSDEPLVLEEQKLRQLMTESDVAAMDAAYKEAEKITLWERITSSNHEDVNYYKGLLFQHTRNLLDIMRIDFLEEITGKHITGKAFEED